MKYIYIIIISIATAALICQYKGDVWEENLRQALYRLSNDSIPNYAKTIVDDKGIPYIRYKEVNGIHPGDEYNPTIVSNYAIDYFKLIEEKTDTSATRKFKNCINWLADNINYKDSFALYEFNWRQPFYDSVGVPWTSGMTSGRAIEAFICAYKSDHKQEYLDHASALLRGYYQPIYAGGFTYKESNGWWYEEFADSSMHTPRILDGHIYAVAGVNKLLELTNNDSAAFIVDQGIKALKKYLPYYDIGNGWSYYDAYHKTSDKAYHTLLTNQMKELWEMTNDPFFKTYYQNWSKPLNRPYIYRILKEKNRSGIMLFCVMVCLLFAVLFWGLKLIDKKLSIK